MVIKNVKSDDLADQTDKLYVYTPQERRNRQIILVLMLVLVKCYNIKMVLSPFFLFITSLIKPEANKTTS